MAVTSPAPGQGRAEVMVAPHLLNPNGVLHGAVVFAMVDTAMGAAVMSLLGDGQACASIEVQVRFLKPILEGVVAADVHVLRRGRRIVHLRADVRSHGEVVAAASGTFAVLDAPPA